MLVLQALGSWRTRMSLVLAISALPEMEKHVSKWVNEDGF